MDGRDCNQYLVLSLQHTKLSDRMSAGDYFGPSHINPVPTPAVLFNRPIRNYGINVETHDKTRLPPTLIKISVR